MKEPLLRVRIKFDKQNYKEKQLYRPLMQDFEFQKRGLKSSKVCLAGPEGKDRVLGPVEYFAQETLPFCRKFPRPIQAFVLAKNLDRVIYYNALPVAFRDAAAPEFFATYPDGEIWYVRQSKNYLSKLWKMEWDVGKKVRPGIKPDALGAWDVQPFAGLDVGSLPYHALLWFSTLFFPNILFAISLQAPGFFLFFPRPIPSFLGPGDKQNLLGLMLSHLDHVYSDWRNPTDSPRSLVAPELLSSEPVSELLEWWIFRISRIWRQFALYSDPKSALIVGLTLNRILVESTLINISLNNFERKMLSFQVIDKISSLLAAARRRPSRDEASAWRQLVSRSFIRERLKPFVSQLPSSLSDFFASRTDWLLQNLQVDNLRPSILRAYRNSVHGYKIRDAMVLLKHGQPIENDIPDLGSILILYIFGSKILSPLKSLSLVRVGDNTKRKSGRRSG